jgi:hypothetical protein
MLAATAIADDFKMGRKRAAGLRRRMIILIHPFSRPRPRAAERVQDAMSLRDASSPCDTNATAAARETTIMV